MSKTKKAEAKESKKTGMAWFRTWAIGNGGMECYVDYLYMDRAMPDEDRGEHIEYRNSPYPSGIRRFCWEEVTVKDLPEGFIKDLIDTVKGKLKRNREWLKELQAML